MLITLSSQSPPYYALGLSILDFFAWGTGWLSCVYYGNSITHPDLEGTMVATVNSVNYIIGEGDENGEMQI
jgi:hypothetical protein